MQRWGVYEVIFVNTCHTIIFFRFEKILYLWFACLEISRSIQLGLHAVQKIFFLHFLKFLCFYRSTDFVQSIVSRITTYLLSMDSFNILCLLVVSISTTSEYCNLDHETKNFLAKLITFLNGKTKIAFLRSCIQSYSSFALL